MLYVSGLRLPMPHRRSDAGDHRMAHHVFAEEFKADLIDFRQYFDGMRRPDLVLRGRSIYGDVAGDHRPGVKADAGQEHLHLSVVFWLIKMIKASFASVRAYRPAGPLR